MIQSRATKGFTLLELMMILLIVVMMASILTAYLGRPRIEVNDTLAKKNLQRLSAAFEAYAGDNDGVYTNDINDLFAANPPYLLPEENPCTLSVSGFSYSCIHTTAGYTFSATPVQMGASGSTNFMIETGGFLYTF